jgi:uncharacterized protein YyaL (SSP411 family)
MNMNSPNRLKDSFSPYLRQHAYNPVDWYPYGKEALEKAFREDKPLLLSIGYAACHWCHVMAHECFEDREIAQRMNDWFVCVKIDREERPDLDMVYMEAVQLMTGQGGWPLHCFALPDGTPFYGGTYFPPLAWTALLTQIHTLWVSDRNRILQAAEEVKRLMATSTPRSSVLSKTAAVDTPKGPFPVPMDQIRSSYQDLRRSFDHKEGGLAGAPKFPLPGLWVTLLEYASYTGDSSAQEQVTLTLRRMAQGGIHDHLGGAFARYATDAQWRIPHFEKMLYDNAQLLELYAKAYLKDPDPLYKKTVEGIVEFCQRELENPTGGFFSSLDADTEGEEGAYYTWRYEEIEALLGSDARAYAKYFSFTPEGNWEEGKNILWIDPKSAIEDGFIETCSRKLFEARSRRPRPSLDDKILTSWNALMIKGLCWAYIAFEASRYLTLAQKTAEFLETNLQKPRGGLYAVWARGIASIEGFASDYALLADSLLDLYEVTGETRYLSRAEQLCSYLIENFSVPGKARFCFSTHPLIPGFGPRIEDKDSVLPSSNAVAADVLLRLGWLLHKNEYIDRSIALLHEVGDAAPLHFLYHYRFLSVGMKLERGPLLVTLSGEGVADAALKIKKINIPHLVCSFSNTGDTSLSVILCKDNVCSAPYSDIQRVLRDLVH